MPATTNSVLADAEHNPTKRNGVSRSESVSLISVCATETESLYFTYLELENPSSTLQDKLLRVTSSEALFAWHSAASYKYTETPSCNSA